MADAERFDDRRILLFLAVAGVLVVVVGAASALLLARSVDRAHEAEREARAEAAARDEIERQASEQATMDAAAAAQTAARAERLAEIERLKPKFPAFPPPDLPEPPGSLVRLRSLRFVELPRSEEMLKIGYFNHNTSPAVMAVHFSPAHDMLLACADRGVWIFDLKDERNRRAPRLFNGFHFKSAALAPDQSALFVSTTRLDRVSPESIALRLDLKSRTWAEARLQVVGGRIRAVDSHRFLMLDWGEQRYPDLYEWSAEGRELRAVHRGQPAVGGRPAVFDYDPGTGRVCALFRHREGANASIHQLDGNALKPVFDLYVPGAPFRLPAPGEPADTQIDSRWPLLAGSDPSLLIHGDTEWDIRKKSASRRFNETIHAQTRDLLLGEQGWHLAGNGIPAGKFGFKTAVVGLPLWPVFAPSPDGRSVWVVDRDAGVVRQYAIEREP